MGMYDTITHKMRCPKCNKKIEFTEQVKWTNGCLLIENCKNSPTSKVVR